ncbi:MAG: PorV/PorQ family protein [Elusimicrobia bacterium]|nr:PorV/PorQ family protein [Elusimicrobiota bacterium]
MKTIKNKNYGASDYGGSGESTLNSANAMVYIFALILTLLVSPTFSPLFSKATGGQPGQFLQWAAGARSLGMGKAFYGVSDDASATYWNPAGLIQLDRNEIVALHTNLWAGTSYDFISFVYPTARLGVFGANITKLRTDGFEKVEFSYNETTQEITFNPGGTFSDDQMALTLAYGRKVMRNISIGLATKLLQRTLDVHTDNMITFDINLLQQGLNSHLPGLKLGFGINNILTQSFNTQDVLPMTFRFGAAHRFLRDKLTMAFDLTKGMKSNINWAIGAEYWMMNFMAMRLGFDGEDAIRESSMGLGFKYRDYGFDYAFAMHAMGISAFRLSGSYKFGASVVAARDSTIRRIIHEGIEAYRRGNFLVAFSRLEKAFAVDPANQDVQKMTRKLQTIISYITSAQKDTEEEGGIRKGVAAYMDDDIPGAVSAFKYAYYKNPQNAKVFQLLNALERGNNLPLTESYKEDIVGFTIIDKKIYDARQLVIEGKYDQSLLRCQEVLNLEPNNVTALEIMGSAFFMMNQRDKAKEVWIKVLELDPTREMVREFLEELK